MRGPSYSVADHRRQPVPRISGSKKLKADLTGPEAMTAPLYAAPAALAVGRRDDPRDLGPGELDLGAGRRRNLVLQRTRVRDSYPFMDQSVRSNGYAIGGQRFGRRGAVPPGPHFLIKKAGTGSRDLVPAYRIAGSAGLGNRAAGANVDFDLHLLTPFLLRYKQEGSTPQIEKYEILGDGEDGTIPQGWFLLGGPDWFRGSVCHVSRRPFVHASPIANAERAHRPP